MIERSCDPGCYSWSIKLPSKRFMYLQLSFQVSTVWGRSGNFRGGAYMEVLSHLMFDFSYESFVLGFLEWTPYATCSSCHDVPTAKLQVKEHYSSLEKHGGGIYYSLGNLAVSISQEKNDSPPLEPSDLHSQVSWTLLWSITEYWRAQSCVLSGQVTAATVTSWLQWLCHVPKTELSDFLSLNQLKNNVCRNKKESAH